MRLIDLILAGLLVSTTASAQGRWVFAPDGGEGPKFGYVPEAGSNNFFPFWIYCETATKRIVINAYVGERRPAGGNGSVTFTAPSEAPATVTGSVATEAFDGQFSLEAELPRTHALFALMAKGQPMAYAGGSTGAALGASNLTSVLQQWQAACR